MSAWKSLSKCMVLGLVASLSACSIYSLPGSQPVPVEKQPDYTEPRPAPPPAEPVRTPGRDADPAVRAAYQPLLDRAAQAKNRGDYEQALALLERAQRIEPDSADIYLAISETHLARGDESQCRASAERGLLYCDSARQCEALRRLAN